MKRLGTGLVLALLVLARADLAEAGSCGGGGSSGGGSSGGGSSGGGGSYSGSDSGSSSGSSTPACHDDTDVVGYRKCTRFASWSTNRHLPMVILELGTAVRRFSSPTGTRTGHVEHDGQPFSYRTIGPAPDAGQAFDTAVVSSLRLGIGLPRGLYGALEAELGGLADQTGGGVEMTSTGPLGTPDIRQRSAMVVSALGVVGVQGSVGSATLGVELVGGVRTVSYQYESHYLACEQTQTLSVATPVLEARARATRWLSPFVNLGVSAGASLVDRGAWLAGIQIGVVTRAYGGTR